MRSFDPKDDAEARREKLRVELLQAPWPASGLSGAWSILIGAAIIAAVAGLAILFGASFL
jgi:hypothetical protein